MSHCIQFNYGFCPDHICQLELCFILFYFYINLFFYFTISKPFWYKLTLSRLFGNLSNQTFLACSLFGLSQVWRNFFYQYIYLYVYFHDSHFSYSNTVYTFILNFKNHSTTENLWYEPVFKCSTFCRKGFIVTMIVTKMYANIIRLA